MAEQNQSEANLAELAPEWKRAIAFVEEHVGGRVIRAERQARWRPAWFFDVETNDGIVPIYFRGARGEAGLGVYTLEHEGAVLEVLAENGVPVPKVWGICSEPPGLVLERSPGRANLATAESEEERRTVFSEYMEWLAKMHAIDLRHFEVRGLQQPKDASTRALGDLASWEKAYRGNKVRAEPMIEFVLGWLKRNMPEGREETTFLCGDAGQFIFENGHMTAVLDLELAYLGDPAADLGALFGRTLSEPLGDLGAGIRHYEACRGVKVDPRVVQYHAIRFGICTPLAVSHLCAEPPPGLVFAQYLSWYVVYGRASLEWIAGLMGVELTGPAKPLASSSRFAPAFASMRAALRPKPDDSTYASFEKDCIDRSAIYLERADLYGAASQAVDQQEAQALLGSTGPVSDQELEEVVAAGDPIQEEALLRFFHARLLREEFLLSPAMRELENIEIPRLI
jgi:hypothetical protein